MVDIPNLTGQLPPKSKQSFLTKVKYFLKTQIWVITLVATLTAAITGGIVYAFNKTLSGTVNIIENGNFSYYSDAAATIPISSVSLGNLSQGATKTFTIYAKNTSSSSEILTAGSNTVPAAIGTLTLKFDGSSSKTVASGGMAKVDGTFVASSTATPGILNFNLSVDAAVTTATTTTTTTTTTTSTTTTTQLVSFASVIQPLISGACVSCHNWASTYTGISSRANDIYNRVSSSTSASGHMPPGASLPSNQIQSIANWISQGALNN